jgi:hypothetical protein
MYPFIFHHLHEQVRERQIALCREAEYMRLLSTLPRQRPRFMLMRRVALAIGNGLITWGAWLRQRALLDPNCTDRQAASGRLSQIANQ